MAKFTVNKNAGYTAMSNYHFRDTTLSWKAKGLLSTMLSLPETWDYSMSGLEKLAKDQETSTRTALKELEEHGYLIRRQIREKGKIVDWEYDIYEYPYIEKPDVENPLLENQGQLITKELITKELNIKDKKEGLSYERPKKEMKAGADAMTDGLDSGEAKGEETKARNPAKRENGVAPENPPAEEKSDFDVFWEAYPNKKGKGQARAAFDRALKKTNLRKILNAIEEQKQTAQWKKEKGRYIPHPATWLNGECWDDEEVSVEPHQTYDNSYEEGESL